ncbi:hypothetical protein E4T45_02527 [Aureobasidium sp. EXF-8846]|nr:hypothetical protein E4T45_02527 [Aureobasidium sp. EXF-8846]
MDITNTDSHQIRLPPAEDLLVQIKSTYPSRAALIQGCLTQGAWTLTDEELKLIIEGITISEQSPLEDITTFTNPHALGPQTPDHEISKNHTLADFEVKSISQCHREQGYRREAARATRLLQRHRLVERRFLELLIDCRHKEIPSSDYALKRRAVEQIMQETKGQTHFPLAPTNESLSQKIQNFAIKAQRKPYHDIGLWGFAILRDDAAWEAYKKFVDFSVQRFLLANDVPQYTCSQFRFIYLEDEAALSGPVDHIKLVKYWEKHQWDETIHLHINKQFFFSADEHVRRNESTADPAIYIHDASVDEVREGAFPGFRETSIIGLINWHIPAIEKSRLHLRTAWEMINL